MVVVVVAVVVGVLLFCFFASALFHPIRQT